MSELKSYKMVDEKYCTDCVCVIPSEVYLKTEADKVISELKKERDWLAKDRAQAYRDLEKRAQLNIKQEDAIRHQKYKRCLAVVRQCKRNRLHACVCGPVDKIDFWDKWEKRWLELAEKFKETEHA